MRSPLSFPLSPHPSIHPGPPDIVVLWLRGPFTKANPKGLLCSLVPLPVFKSPAATW